MFRGARNVVICGGFVNLVGGEMLGIMEGQVLICGRGIVVYRLLV